MYPALTCRAFYLCVYSPQTPQIKGNQQFTHESAFSAEQAPETFLFSAVVGRSGRVGDCPGIMGSGGGQ